MVLYLGGGEGLCIVDFEWWRVRGGRGDCRGAAERGLVLGQWKTAAVMGSRLREK